VTLLLDHLAVCTRVGGPEGDQLVAAGLTEGGPNTHAGQGTANRRFFFHNAMLELLWVRDETEARSPATARTRIADRWQNRDAGACPFGLCVRSAGAPPFPAWAYRPAFLPPPFSIGIAENSDTLDEPMLFHVSFGSRPDQLPPERRQPLEHRLRVREITRLLWLRPGSGALSLALRVVVDAGVLSVASGPAHALEIGFDDEVRGRSLSLSPELPITLRW
jgi:hypothetical protein